jgi:hypothetical protein
MVCTIILYLKSQEDIGSCILGAAEIFTQGEVELGLFRQIVSFETSRTGACYV